MRKTHARLTLWRAAYILALIGAICCQLQAMVLGQQPSGEGPLPVPAAFRAPATIDDPDTVAAAKEHVPPRSPDDGMRPAFGKARGLTAPDVTRVQTPVGAKSPEPIRLPPKEKPAQAPPQVKPIPSIRIPSDDSGMLYPLQLTPPGNQQLFQLESEDAFRERLRNEARNRSATHRPEFPDSAPVRSRPAISRAWTGYTMNVEPSYVVSHRLFFEQPRFERYGHSLGILQPTVSSGIFFWDTLHWPLRQLAQPCRWHQVNLDGYSPYFEMVGTQDRNSDR